MQQPRSSRAALGAVSLVFASSAFALVGNVQVDANENPSWGGVVSITIAGKVYSGALIDRTHVLTAAHVVSGSADHPGNVTVNVNFGSDFSQQIAASRVFIHEDYFKGNKIGVADAQFAWNDDIAVVRLSSPVAENVPVYSLLDRALGLGTQFTMVAYGGNADGYSASITAGSSATVKRVGENRITELYAADDDGKGIPAYDEVFRFTFSTPGTLFSLEHEAGYAGGDSGSPIFVNDSGVWRIAGVGAFNGSPVTIPGASIQYGAIGGGMLISPYIGWIEQKMAAPVPEPETYALMLAGLGLVAAAARLRRRPTSQR